MLSANAAVVGDSYGEDRDGRGEKEKSEEGVSPQKVGAERVEHGGPVALAGDLLVVRPSSYLALKVGLAFRKRLEEFVEVFDGVYLKSREEHVAHYQEDPNAGEHRDDRNARKMDRLAGHRAIDNQQHEDK